MPRLGGRFLWRIIRLTTGGTLLLLGVVGLFLPVLPGLLLIASGLAVLSTESRWARRLLDKLKSWHHRKSAADTDPKRGGDEGRCPPAG